MWVPASAPGLVLTSQTPDPIRWTAPAAGGGGGGGGTDHATLSNLAWTVSGHTGTASRVAGFSGAGAAAYYQIGAVGGLQAYDAGLQSLSALPTAADRYAYSTAADTWTEGTITAAGRAILSGGTVPVAQLGTGTPTATTVLRGDGTWGVVPSGAVDATTVEITIASLATRGSFTITDSAITTTRRVLVWQTSGPSTGRSSRADESEMDPIDVVSVVSGTGSATVVWETRGHVVANPAYPGSPAAPGTNGARANTSAVAASTTIRTQIERRGRVVGKYTFAYLVLG